MIRAVLVIALLGGLGMWFLLPKPGNDKPEHLPWQTGVDARGRLQAFGVTLGATTLGEVQEDFGQSGEITLFVDPAGDPHSAVEVFFERIYLNGLRGDFVFSLAVDPDARARIYERGLRISRLGNGTQKVQPAPVDQEALAAATIVHITYLPAARLDAKLIRDRFGEPAEQVTEPNGIVHWLYPDKGIDLARQSNGRIVIQYVNPSDFNLLREPLRAARATAPSSPADHN